MNELVIKEYLGNGVEFKIIKGEIYANATSMCKPFGKVAKDWLKTAQTQRYITALEQKDNYPNGMISVSKGGIVEDSGTWIHEKLVLKLSSWLDVEFELWIDEQIATLIREGSVSLKPKTEEAMLLELFPSTDNNLILLTANTIRDNKRLTIKIKEDEPKVNFADRITNSSDAVDIGSFVKVLYDEDIKIGRNKFFEWLRVNKYLMDGNMPYQRYVDNGYFKVIEVIKNTVYGEKIFPKTLITGKGQFNIAEKLRIEFNTSSN